MISETELAMSKANSYTTGPDENGRFGIFGGRFVAETLMPLLLDLEKAYGAARVKIRHFSTSYRTYKLIMSDDPAPYILQSALQNIMAAQKSISNGMS